ncbi:hypothetical protein HAX54_023340 [Datura stramonium]|uniref:Uncharacterized protein n=1 Tax=Datura stramonium TaxID=4076 RepID=A0ABS8UWT7_DATST|nr:hypothetical protein [Datura stramonium]
MMLLPKKLMKLWRVMKPVMQQEQDHHSCGGGYTPLGPGGAGGRYTPTVEEVQRQEDTSYMLGRSSAVGTSKVPSCTCECLKCNENMNMLLSKIEASTEAQGVKEACIDKLTAKRWEIQFLAIGSLCRVVHLMVLEGSCLAPSIVWDLLPRRVCPCANVGALAPAPAENYCFFACAMVLGWSCCVPSAALGQGFLA